MFNVTNQAELEAFCAYAMPVFLERLKTAAMKAGNIELATTLEGVTSLPSIQSLGRTARNSGNRYDKSF